MLSLHDSLFAVEATRLAFIYVFLRCVGRHHLVELLVGRTCKTVVGEPRIQILLFELILPKHHGHLIDLLVVVSDTASGALITHCIEVRLRGVG